MSPTSIGVNLRVTGHCNQGGRKYMEDFFSVAYQQSTDEKDLEYAFFGIYDGHGGSEAATFAKEHLMNAIVNQKLFWSDCDQDVLRAIREGYIATHYAMWREQEKWPKTATGLPSTAGTTASVAFIRRGKIYIGHVGDSGIVLGYQEEGEKCWRAKPLTHDHKPECNVEKARIINSGGKVVTKSGVPRVVWNRPRIGHKGPVRRSTPIDEIPFLAVARSLGDLWSYNSALDQFVVSPDPDVKVVKIDPKTYRCLIFGTDGLWNVLSPADAVDIAHDTEIINETLVYMGGPGEWTNPSKFLVDKALERWNTRRMRADNTSVVTIMLDPPGPPKRDTILRNCPTASYGLEYIQMEGVNEQQDYQNTRVQNFTPAHDEGIAMYDQEMREVHPHHPSDMSDSYSLPSSGYAIMTRYESNCDNNYMYYDNHEMMSSTTTTSSPMNQPTSNAVHSDSILSSSLTQDIQYMNSFAESYNSLLISNYENENGNSNTISGNSGIDNADSESRGDYHSYHSLDETGLAGHDHVHHHHPNSYNQQQQHQYQQQCMSAEEGYSLTKLETRGEQQFISIQSYRQQQNVSFQDFDDESTYPQYASISSSYKQSIIVSPTRDRHSRYDGHTIINEDRIPPSEYIVPQNVIDDSGFNEDRNYYEPNVVLSQNKEEDRGWMNEVHDETQNRNTLDEGIQINEISSSVVETSPPSSISDDSDCRNSPDIIKSNKIYNACPSENKVKLKKRKQSVKSTSRSKTNQKSFSNEQNENVCLTERRQLRSSIDYTKRTLRSRDCLSKDLKTKSTQQIRRMTISNQISTMCPKLRPRQIQQQPVTVWSTRTSRKSKSVQLSQSLPNNSVCSKNEIKIRQPLLCNRTKSSPSVTMNNSNKLQSKVLSNSSSSSCITTSSVSSTSMSKKSSSTRDSAWCSRKTTVQTRNRVQKRISH